jgi:UPF0755 protein
MTNSNEAAEARCPPTIPMKDCQPRHHKYFGLQFPSKYWRWCLIALLALIAGSLGILWFWLQQSLSTSYKGYADEEKLVLISPGQSTELIVQILQGEGILERRLPALVYFWWQRSRGGIKAGEYQFQKPMTVTEVADKLIDGKVYQHAITIPEGLTLRQIAAIMEVSGLSSAKEALEAMQDITLLSDIDPAASDLEGYVFPDTYYYVRGTKAKELVRRIVNRFKKIFKESWRTRAVELGLGIRGAVTLASLIEKETAVPEERSMISSVFHHRLAQGMPLQCDPTVIYASTLIGKFDGTIRRSDLELKSPYNTYFRAGLPPGPIASPGVQSLEAALFPASSAYLYFVARKDGTHQFSETIAAHQKAVKTYRN